MYYHGTWNAYDILRDGFDLAKLGTNKRNYGALGAGIYFSAKEDVADGYGRT